MGGRRERRHGIERGERQPRTAAAGMGQDIIATAEHGCCWKGTEYNENRH